MAKLTTAEFIEAIKELSVLELNLSLIHIWLCGSGLQAGPPDRGRDERSRLPT